ncbi:DUF4214 domain-containing protein [Devosia sp. 1635]|uniref:DUF4214 domain-containing protein n=1 Tax=Devosia sp. 1635 TaxID=2726066 RepID=UPI0015679B8A|nr:DUF4214 domain-containing protein [Devosia sp. 1635]
MTSWMFGPDVLYIALFGRPVDPAGAEWLRGPDDYTWINPEAVQNITSSDEYQQFFGEHLGPADYINQMYMNLFNRPADPEGLAFYTGRYEAGVDMADLALEIFSGAQSAGPDRDTMFFKYDASVRFTRALDTPLEILLYQGDNAADIGREYLRAADPNEVGREELAALAESYVELLGTGDPTPSLF